MVGAKQKSPKGVGIEIELESSSPMPGVGEFDTSRWSKQIDGSLRGADSAEFVLRAPVRTSKVNEVLLELKGIIKSSNTQVMDSVRAGTHIHYDVSNLSVKEFYTFLCVWYTLEELLSSQFGEGRQGNHFCLRAVDAEWVIHTLSEEVRTGRFIGTYLGNNTIRYCALNLTSLFKYGTVEFRALRGSLDNLYITRWVNILDSVVKNSRLFKDPKQVVLNFSEGGEAEFVRHILGPEEAGSFLVHPEATSILRRGARLAQDIAYSTEEW